MKLPLRMPWRQRSPPGPMLLPRALWDNARGGGVAAPPAQSSSMGVPRERGDDWLIGSALLAFRAERGLDEGRLMAYLGITPDRLRGLRLRRRPNPDAPSFEDEVDRLAFAFHCDPEALFDVLSI